MSAESGEIEIKDVYPHEYNPSVFIMFTKGAEVVWSYSGNNLKHFYLKNPEAYISGPIEVPITEQLDHILTEYVENF